MLRTATLKTAELADAVFAASRQIWLAGLGAAVVTCDWARRDARTVFSSLVKEGGTLENQLTRVIGDRIGTSVIAASTAWKQAQETTLSTVRALSATLARPVPQSAAPETPKDARRRGHAIKKSPSRRKSPQRAATKA